MANARLVLWKVCLIAPNNKFKVVKVEAMVDIHTNKLLYRLLGPVILKIGKQNVHTFILIYKV